jgi:hypothetical protein
MCQSTTVVGPDAASQDTAPRWIPCSEVSSEGIDKLAPCRYQLGTVVRQADTQLMQYPLQVPSGD